MSQDASPGIAKALTTLRENTQSAQDWSPGTFSAVPGGTQFVGRVLTQGFKALHILRAFAHPVNLFPEGIFLSTHMEI
jgi:hypothetical protein